jgi:hypothetical protein
MKITTNLRLESLQDVGNVISVQNLLLFLGIEGGLRDLNKGSSFFVNNIDYPNA